MVESLLKRKGLLKILVPLTGLAVVGSLLFFLEKKPRPPSAPPEEKTLSLQPSYSNTRAYREILDIQKAFTRNAKKIKPAVVSVHNLIEIENASASLRHSHRESTPWILALKQWLLHLNHITYQVEKFGSGLILDQEGHILTNYHLIKDADRLRIKLADGQEFLAKSVGFDPLTNLAVLKIFTFKKLPQAPLSPSYHVKTGEWVMAIGNPYGLEGTVTVGVVSGTGQTNSGIPDIEGLIQTDVSISPGNSGGPLINLQGNVVGINMVLAGAHAESNYTLPIERAIRISDQLIRNGRVERGWLGVGIQPLTPELANSFNLSKLQGGVLVNLIEPKTPAEHGGLKRGDIIVRFDGKRVSRSRTLQRWVSNARIGKIVTIQVIRNGAEKNLRVKIGRLDSQWLSEEPSGFNPAQTFRLL